MTARGPWVRALGQGRESTVAGMVRGSASFSLVDELTASGKGDGLIAAGTVDGIAREEGGRWLD